MFLLTKELLEHLLSPLYHNVFLHSPAKKTVNFTKNENGTPEDTEFKEREIVYLSEKNSDWHVVN